MRPVLHLLRARFPLCTVAAWSVPEDYAIELRVTDAGGLVARERVALQRIVSEANALDVFDAAIGRLADVFETPSHWMAL